MLWTYLEKAASGASGASGASVASGACEHLARNHAILRTFLIKSPSFLTQDGGRRVEDGKLRMDQ